MELTEVLRTTGAVREFTDEPVDDATLHAVLDAARFAPNGGNRQGWHVVVVKDPSIRARLAEQSELGAREYAAYLRAGRVPFAPERDGRWDPEAVDLEAARATPSGGLADFIARAPVNLLVVADLTALAVTDNGLDRQSIVGGGSVYPFCHNVLLAARDLGLGGVLTTFVLRGEPALRAPLGIPDHMGIAALIVLGHPVKQITRLRRAPVEDFTTVDTLDGRPFGRDGEA